MDPRHSTEVSATYDIMLSICREVGVPLGEEKCVPPPIRMELLSVVLDNTSMTIALFDWSSWLCTVIYALIVLVILCSPVN